MQQAVQQFHEKSLNFAAKRQHRLAMSRCSTDCRTDLSGNMSVRQVEAVQEFGLWAV